MVTFAPGGVDVVVLELEVRGGVVLVLRGVEAARLVVALVAAVELAGLRAGGGVAYRRGAAELDAAHVVTGSGEGGADLLLGLEVVALPEVRVADAAVDAEQVLGGPEAVLERAPRAEVVVLRHRPSDVEAVHRREHVVCLVLEVELRGVHADDDEAAGGVLRVPVAQVGQGADAVDAGVGPEVDEHDVALLELPGDRERLRVEPAGQARQFALRRDRAVGRHAHVVGAARGRDDGDHEQKTCERPASVQKTCERTASEQKTCERPTSVQGACERAASEAECAGHGTHPGSRRVRVGGRASA